MKQATGCSVADGNLQTGIRPALVPCPWQVEVRKASAGLGLFAAEAIPARSFVIEYAGRLLSEDEFQRSRSLYLFDIGPKGALDGSPRWNLARYINHSCAPNCTYTIRRKRVLIRSLRDIAAGEELTYDYGAEYFDEYIGANCQCVTCAPKAHRRPRPR